MINFIVKKIMGTQNERELKRLSHKIQSISALEPEIAQLSDPELKAKTDWYGAVYAPEANVTIHADGDIYGSFVGTTFENKAKGRIVYDTALRGVDVTDEDVRFVIDNWFEQ